VSGSLELAIRNQWDGTPCADVSLHGQMTLTRTPEGLELTGRLPLQTTPNEPAAPAGYRVANLWEYDVVECFLAGDDGYLEVEVARDGRWLVLSFGAPRQLVSAHEELKPIVRWGQDVTHWWTTVVIPPGLLPQAPWRGNAFVIAGGRYMAWSPLPGRTPDFHLPTHFPRIGAG
jgi:hypothetical protein